MPFHEIFHHLCCFFVIFLTLHENIITAPRLLLSKGPFNLDISATLPNYQTFPHSFFSIFSPSPRYHAIAAEIISTETCCVYDCKTKKISSSLFYYGLQFTTFPSYHPSHDNLNIIIEYIYTATIFTLYPAISRRIPRAILYFRAFHSYGK